MMTVGEALAGFRALPLADLHTITGGARLLIIAPHPDDESLGCGGLIAESCRRGMPPCVLFLTDGTQSHPGSRRYKSARLRDLREREGRRAVARLGLPGCRIRFARVADTRAAVRIGEMAERVAQLARQQGCAIVVAPWLHDPHCDHEAAQLIARAACAKAGMRLLSYPVWGWTLPPEKRLPPDTIAGWRLDIAAHLPAKRRAIAAHASQHGGMIRDDPGGFRLPRNLLSIFDTPFETYLQTPVETGSWPDAVFDRIYAAAADPWNMRESAYEIAKYDATLAALPRRRFHVGFEPGCSIGVMTRRLAARCDALLAMDVAEAALARARAFCASLPAIEFARGRLPDDWPDRTFDLVLLSEILYFLSPADLRRTAQRLCATLTEDGAALLVNWTGPTDTPCTGDVAAEIFISACAPALIPSRQRRHDSYRLDLLERRH